MLLGCSITDPSYSDVYKKLAGVKDYEEILGLIHDEAHDRDAFDYFLAEAETDNADAQVVTGLFLQYGIGVGTSRSEALIWYRKAADLGHPLAQFMMGIHHQNFREPQHQILATKWFSESANAGCVLAQFAMGQRYRDGAGVEQNDTEAVEWFQRAADRNQAQSLFWLGRHYLDGRGVTADPSKARDLFRKALVQTSNSEFKRYITTFLTEGAN